MYLWLGGIIAGIVLAGAFADTGFRFAIPDDWETLLVGCIAWLSYLAVKRKTKHDKEVKGIVAKAALGNDLNAICTYAETVYELTYKILICYQAAEGINDKEPYNSLQTDIDLNNKALKEAISNFRKSVV